MQSIIPQDLIGVVLGYLPKYMNTMVQSFEEVTVDELKEMMKQGLDTDTLVDWAVTKGYTLDDESAYIAIKYRNDTLARRHTEAGTLHPNALYAAGTKGTKDAMNAVWAMMTREQENMVDYEVLARRIIESGHPSLFMDVYNSNIDDETCGYCYGLLDLRVILNVGFDYDDPDMFDGIFNECWEEFHGYGLEHSFIHAEAARRGNMAWFKWLRSMDEWIYYEIPKMAEALACYPFPELVQWINDIFSSMMVEYPDDIEDTEKMLHKLVGSVRERCSDMTKLDDIARTIEGPFSSCYLALQ